MGGGDFEQLCRNASLAHLVIFEGKILDELVRVVGRVFHRHHARAVLGSTRVEDHLENLILNVIRQHDIEHYLGGRLEDIAQHRIDIFICVPGGFFVFFRQAETADRQEGLHDRALINRVNEMRVEDRNVVHLALQKLFRAKF